VLVFPKITKAGFIVGGENGQGTMFMGRAVIGYFQITAGSIGLQAGAQTYGYALFFMNQKAIDYVRQSDGWSIGTGPTVVIVDKGAATSLNTTTLRKDVYAVAFDQRGLMAGIGLQGSKISHIKP
jgi:lipid-binding SYLF domain-containing protein